MPTNLHAAAASLHVAAAAGLLALLMLRGRLAARKDEKIHRRWLQSGSYDLDTKFCNIERINGSAVTRAKFMTRYMAKRPVIFILPPSRNLNFTARVARAAMLRTMGSKRLKLSSSNSYSHARRTATVADYIEEVSGARVFNIL